MLLGPTAGRPGAGTDRRRCARRARAASGRAAPAARPGCGRGPGSGPAPIGYAAGGALVRHERRLDAAGGLQRLGEHHRVLQRHRGALGQGRRGGVRGVADQQHPPPVTSGPSSTSSVTRDLHRRPARPAPRAPARRSRRTAPAPGRPGRRVAVGAGLVGVAVQPAGTDRHHHEPGPPAEQCRPVADRRAAAHHAAVDDLAGRAGPGRRAAALARIVERRPSAPMTRSYSAPVPSVNATSTPSVNELQVADLGAVPHLAPGPSEQHLLEVARGAAPGTRPPRPRARRRPPRRAGRPRRRGSLAEDQLPERPHRAVEAQPAQRAGGVAGQVETGRRRLRWAEVSRRRPAGSRPTAGPGRRPDRRCRRRRRGCAGGSHAWWCTPPEGIGTR